MLAGTRPHSALPVAESPEGVTSALLQRLQALGMSDSYVVVPCAGLPLWQLHEYWKKLEAADTLKYRWSDQQPEDLDCIQQAEYSKRTANQYAVYDVENSCLVGDFSLGPFTGKAAQVHFSCSPENSTELSLHLTDQITTMILQTWSLKPAESYADALFGIMPLKNRAACLFIRKAGFQKLGVLKQGTHYLGQPTDALLTAKYRRSN